jgi:hypothetical protein
MGGAINFSTNYSKSSEGGIAWSTYLIFVGFGEFPCIHVNDVADKHGNIQNVLVSSGLSFYRRPSVSDVVMVPRLPCPVASAGSRNLQPYSSICNAERSV